MNPMNIFVGVPQSKYAAIAIVVALIFVAFAMIFGKEQVPVGQKFLFVLIMFIVALPTVLFTLFQLTCIVTGAGMKNQRWWCAAYAWIGTIFIIIYSVILVIVGISSMMNGANVLNEINNTMTFEQMMNAADTRAAEYFQNMEGSKPAQNPLAPTMHSNVAPFTVSSSGSPSVPAAPSTGTTVSHFTGTAAPEGDGVSSDYVPPETPEQELRNKMATMSMGNVPVPASTSQMENFADFLGSLEQEENKNNNERREMFRVTPNTL